MKTRSKNNTYTQQARRVVSFLFGLWHEAPVATSIMALSQIIGTVASTAIAPLFVSQLLTYIARGTANLHNSTSLLIGYAISLIIGEIIAIRITIAMAYIGENRMQQRNAQRVIRSQMDKTMNFHANHMSGGIVSDATKLNGSIERFWDTLMFTVIPIVSTIISVSIALSFFVWQYAIILFSLSLCIAFFIIRAQNTIAPISRASSEKSSAVTAYLADVIANMGTVKAFAGSRHEETNYTKKLDEWRKINRKEMKSVLIVTGSFGALMTIMNVVAFLGAIIVTEHHIASIGPTYLVIGYTLNIVSQLWQVSSATRNFTRIIGDAAPMIAMLDEPPELSDPAKPEKPRISRGDITFHNVTFTHDGSEGAIFNNLTIHIKPGEKVGLVGHSGSGKTTMTRLLLRFSDIQSGSITIDGQNIAAISQDDLRRHIAYVPQEPLLFHRTIRENIAYGVQAADTETVEAIAKLASAHDFIVKLPKGYDTLVGERGVKLSGGQRQRIAIARAMLKNAPILVLDEATSALDSESEVLIQDALWRLMQGRTAIVIAHRLSTIQKMDRIVVLDDGKIVEEGSHRELVGKKDGTYAKLWSHQSGGFMEE
jgi:ATP-binding cassette subfamily B protein